MVNTIRSELDKDGIPPEKILTVLIFTFGIVMFIAGFYFGEWAQYQKIDVDLEWYSENCECRVRNFTYPPLTQNFNFSSWNVSQQEFS